MTMEDVLIEQIAETSALVVDHEYRMILLELGISEEGAV